MTVNQKVTGTAVSMPVGIVIGCVVSAMITILGAMLAAMLISREMIKDAAIGYAVMIIVIGAAAFGTRIAVKKTKRRKLQVAMMTGGLYYGILLAATALFFGAQYQGMGVTALLVVAGTGLTILTGNGRWKNAKPGKGRRCSY